MQYTNTFGTFLVGLLAASELAAAMPASFRQHAPVYSNQGRGGVSVKQVRNLAAHHPRSRAGALALEKIYMKFGSEMSEELTSAVSRIRANFANGLDAMGLGSLDGVGRRATGSVATKPEEYDVEYLTPVQIGTPAQQLNLNFDTGSSDLWVYSADTPSSEVNGQAVYDPSASSTSENQTDLSWSISYGDGSSSSGNVFYDKVEIGGLSVESMAVETATTVSSEFTSDSNMDGLLGLGFSNLNTVLPTQQKTFFDQAKDNLTSFLFTADLKASEPGTYNFGYIDNSSYTGDITYTAVDDSQGYWMHSLSGFAVGDSDFNATTIDGISDTGTTLLMLPTAVVEAYYAQVQGAAYDALQGGYTFPCNNTAPSFTVGVEKARLVIPGEYMVYAPLDAANTTCYGGIQDDSDIGFAIFGDVMLKAAFVVFEGGDSPQIGFASKDLGLDGEADSEDDQVSVVTTVVTVVG